MHTLLKDSGARREGERQQLRMENLKHLKQEYSLQTGL